MPSLCPRVVAALWLLLVTAGRAGAAPASGGCVGSLGAAGVDVARAQLALTASCLAPATADIAACVANDGDTQLAAARQATVDAAVAECTEPPAVGVADLVDEAVNVA